MTVPYFSSFLTGRLLHNTLGLLHYTVGLLHNTVGLLYNTVGLLHNTVDSILFFHGDKLMEVVNI